MGVNMFKKIFLTISSLSILLSIGCSDLTKENYDRLKVGMSYSEVETILGEADQCIGTIGIKNCKWGDDKKYIAVNFAEDKIIIYSGQGF
jgi:hypothetical protein